MIKLLAFTALITITLIAATGNRQKSENPLSPGTDTAIKLGTHTVTVEYSAPSARGRRVEGGLIPYGQWYRLGADEATTLTTDADIKIGGLLVPKGVHTLFLLATKTSWKLIVNNQKGQWGLDYDPKQDLGRIDMKLTKLPAPVEKFKMTLTSSGAKAGTLAIEWGTTRAEAPIVIE